MGEFDVGDEVYYIGNDTLPIYLKKGRVLFSGNNGNSFLVEFGIPTKNQTYYHHEIFNGLGKEGYCWYANHTCITKDKVKVLKLALDNKGD